MKRNLVVFTGAGISKESGIPTFRDTADGLYLDTSIEEAVTKEGWKKNRQLVIDFHNKLRKGIVNCEPNKAHTILKNLEEKYNVTIITQNVDDLHERAGSSNILHLHGELLKSRSTYPHKDSAVTFFDQIGDMDIDDKCPKGARLRPHTVFFGEEPYNVQESYEALMEADILVIIGTSLEIVYTIQLLACTQAKEIYYIDPKPSLDSLQQALYRFNKPTIKPIKQVATKGVAKLYKILTK